MVTVAKVIVAIVRKEYRNTFRASEIWCHVD